MDFTVDLGTVQSKDDLHNILSTTFNFPSYYGRNLDALFDLIMEPHDEWNIVFKNSVAAEQVLGDYFNSLKETFADASDEGSPIKTVWE